MFHAYVPTGPATRVLVRKPTWGPLKLPPPPPPPLPPANGKPLPPEIKELGMLSREGQMADHLIRR